MENSVSGRRAPPIHRPICNGDVVPGTPCGSSSSTSEHTAAMSPLRPARRHEPTVCTSRSSVGTTTSTTPRGANRCAATAPTYDFPVPVAICTVARNPPAATCPGPGVSARTTAATASS
nr:hypothetical protein [Kitasatospora cineracea]